MNAPEDKLELSVTRFIDAPPDRVWQIMTERMTEWWCPRPWRVELVEQDRRPGGRSAMVMHGPEGERIPLEGIFLEVTPGRRIVTTDAMTADWQPQGPFMIGVWQIEPQDKGTRYTASARHWSKEKMEEHRAMGFAEGWGICADQLAELAEGA